MSDAWPTPEEGTDGGRGPLSGIRIVEMATFISAPLATAMLSDLGADVIKIEPPKGDPMRRLARHPAGVHPMWLNANRGKRGVTLDLKQPAAQHLARQLLGDADVMVTNWRASVAERLGLGDGVLAAANRRLIRVYVSGFGPTGPLADAPVFDSIIQARSGFTEAKGDGVVPALDPYFTVDKGAATMVAQAVLAALVGRERHGCADRVDVAMLDAAVYTNFIDVMANRTLLAYSPPDARNTHPASVRPLATADGWIVVIPVTGDQIRRTLLAVDRADVIDAVLGVRDGAAMSRRLLDEVEQVARRTSTAALLEAFARHDVPAAPCLTIDEHLGDEQVQHNELYEVHEWPAWPSAGPMRQVRHPAVFSTWGKLHSRGGPPPLADPAG